VTILSITIFIIYKHLASAKNSRLSFHRVFICIRILQMAEPVLITKKPGISEICTVSGRLFYGHCRS